MPCLPRLHSDEETRYWIEHIVLPGCAVWVAASADQIVGFAALDDHELDHLYLHPDWRRRGVGSKLLGLITEQSPQELELKVFQRNTAARDFYERHGFVATDHNDGSRNEENEPDMTYRWTPAAV
jgi:GNAT superfamily N-acetyltransferase